MAGTPSSPPRPATVVSMASLWVLLVVTMAMAMTVVGFGRTAAAASSSSSSGGAAGSFFFVTAFQTQKLHHQIHNNRDTRRATNSNNSGAAFSRRSPRRPLFSSTLPDNDAVDGGVSSTTATTAATTTTPSTTTAHQSHKDQQSKLLDFVLRFQQQSTAITMMKEKKRSLSKLLRDQLPPPPEDQFIMTGDIFVLFLYGFTSHSLNDFIVSNVLSDRTQSIQQAVHSLDPMGEIVNLQAVPVWVETQYTASVDRALSVSAQENLLSHWGPLFSTEGSACCTLVACWLVAGWIHRAFHYSNSVDCTTDKALSKVLETWVSMAIMLTLAAVGTSVFVDHFIVGPHHDLPTLLLQQQRNLLLCGDVVCNTLNTAGTSATSTATGAAAAAAAIKVPGVLTKADGMFIVDSMSVLVAWRFMANRMLNMW
eukprot:CAMPEP_0113484532 /NCGR_PEP_ID=MMETSP0014_2-20120614/24008_1 /TAXON_ID=2857 /ORGANISM="Nitzschia sp." /LENGTH=423 /DNA_ID=CAMNT_0000378133 /DNA_START=362 /DNA_END=1630 /DNA_ORIENTATION=- /assembly_acc=CAM_ASM_000159